MLIAPGTAISFEIGVVPTHYNNVVMLTKQLAKEDNYSVIHTQK